MAAVRPVSRSAEELVREARRLRLAGDEAAAKECASEAWLLCERRVRLRIARKAHGATADDILAATAERYVKWLWHRRDEPRKLIALVFHMADRSIADHYADHQPESELMDTVGADDPQLAAVLDADAAAGLLDQLSARDRDILESIYLSDEPRDSVAARHGVQLNNLYQIQFRALAKLRALWEEAR
jgi:RNA polymerase sigma factor (sigma-70 family)